MSSFRGLLTRQIVPIPRRTPSVEDQQQLDGSRFKILEIVFNISQRVLELRLRRRRSEDQQYLTMPPMRCNVFELTLIRKLWPGRLRLVRPGDSFLHIRQSSRDPDCGDEVRVQLANHRDR